MGLGAAATGHANMAPATSPACSFIVFRYKALSEVYEEILGSFGNLYCLSSMPGQHGIYTSGI